MHRRRMPFSLSLTVSVAALACMLLAPAGASARRTRSGERSSPVLPQESTPPSEPTVEQPTPRESESPGAGESTPGAPGESRHQGRAGERARGCTTTVTVSSPITTAGQPLTLSGQLSCRAGSVAEAPVTIYVRARADRGIAGAEEVGVATTAADGSYTFATSAPSHNVSFVVRGPSGRGAHANVKVGPLVELSGPPAEAAAAGGRGARGARQQWTFSGSVDPAVSGARVVLQREYPAEQERWHTFAVGVVGADGRFAIVHALPARGAVSVRAVAHIKGDLAAASEPLSFTITATQNPQLTIAASSAAVSSGQPVTISGVDAGAAGQQVTLLARTAGGPFVALADDTAGAGGEYTFTTTPTQRTQYRVTSAAEQSSILLEGFKYLLTAEPAPTTIAAGARLALTGTVVAAPVGQPVYLERETGFGRSFHVIASATVRADSSYSIPYAFGRRTTAILRIRVPANAVSDGSTSEPFSVAVSGEELADAPAS